MTRLVCLLAALGALGWESAAAQPKKSGTRGTMSQVVERDLAKTRERLAGMQAEYAATQDAIAYLNVLLQGNPPPLKLLQPGFNDLSRLNPRDPAEKIKIQLRINDLCGSLTQLERQIKLVNGRIARMEKTVGAASASDAGGRSTSYPAGYSLGKSAARTMPAPMETTDPRRYAELVSAVAPGFSINGSGEKGVGLLAEYCGHRNVLRTHPIDRRQPCILQTTLDLPAGKPAKLVVEASNSDQGGDWQLVVRANKRQLLDTVVGMSTTDKGWLRREIDLSAFAGQRVQLEAINAANGWFFEFAYWGQLEVVFP